MSPSIDIPVTHRASITPSQEVLSLYDPLGNPPSPTSLCGRSDVDSNESPPTELRSMLESWNAFTPEQMPSTLSNSHSLDSFALMSPVSPEAIGLDELIDDNFTTSSRSVSINPFPILAVGYSPRKDSPYPHKPLFTYSTTSEPASAQDSPEVRSESVEQSMTFARVELGKPVPIRQMPWTTRTNASRTSSAPSSSRPVQLSVSPLGGLFQPPTPAKSPRTKPLHAVDPVSDLFSPGYSIATGTAPLHPEPEHTNSLNLHLNTPTVTPRTAHEPNASFHGSKIAAGHLRGKVLNPQFTQRFTVGDELGSGGFGFVCSAIQTGYDNAPGVEVAVKFVFKSRLGEDQEGEDTCGMIDGIPIEAHVLSRCSHPGVVGFVALYEDEEFFYLVQELHGDPWAAGHTLEAETKAPQTSSSLPQLFALGMPSPYLPSPSEGSEWNFASPTPPTEMKEFIFPALSTSTAPLPIPQTPQKDWVQSVFPSYLPPTPITAPAKRPPMGRRASHDLFEAVEHRRFTEEQGRFIFKQIVDAVAYLHRRGIYHRDLKDENIVIDRNLNIKIIDFGSAVVEDRLAPPVIHTQFRGTMSYASAEIIKGQAYEAAPADIWSIGIILSIILTGESPFPNPSYAQIGRIKVKTHISPMAYDLMAGCLISDPRWRIGIEEIVRHPWLNPSIHRASV